MMTLTLNSKKQKYAMFEKYKYLGQAQFLLERGLLMGFTLDKMMENMTGEMKYMTEDMIIMARCKTFTEFAERRYINESNANKLSRMIAEYLKAFFHREIMQKQIGQDIMNLAILGDIFGTTLKTISKENNLDAIEKELFMKSSEELRKLASITSMIHQSLEVQ